MMKQIGTTIKGLRIKRVFECTKCKWRTKYNYTDCPNPKCKDYIIDTKILKEEQETKGAEHIKCRECEEVGHWYDNSEDKDWITCKCGAEKEKPKWC